jgi:hypothetical protein
MELTRTVVGLGGEVADALQHGDTHEHVRVTEDGGQGLVL